MVVERERHAAVVLRLHEEVGDDLLVGTPHRFAQRTARARVQSHEVVLRLLELCVAEAELLLYLVPVFVGKFVVTLPDDVLLQCLQGRMLLASDLDEEALLEAACADAGRVEILDDFQDALQFGRCRLHSIVEQQFVADGLEVLAQQSVVVERADEVFGQLPLAVAQLAFAELFLEDFVEGDSLREGDFLCLCSRAFRLAELVVGDVVFRAVVAQLHVFSRHVRSLVVLSAGGKFLVGRVLLCRRRTLLQGRIVEQFGPHAFFQFDGGQFEQLDGQHLLGREGLHLLLFLYLVIPLLHDIRFSDAKVVNFA